MAERRLADLPTFFMKRVTQEVLTFRKDHIANHLGQQRVARFAFQPLPIYNSRPSPLFFPFPHTVNVYRILPFTNNRKEYWVRVREHPVNKNQMCYIVELRAKVMRYAGLETKETFQVAKILT